jgi:hypothetical protein
VGPGIGRHGKKVNAPLTSEPQAKSILFQISNSAQTGKFIKEAFSCSKNTQALHGAILNNFHNWVDFKFRIEFLI